MPIYFLFFYSFTLSFLITIIVFYAKVTVFANVADLCMIDYTESEKTVVNADVDVGFDGRADVDVDVGCVERKDLAGFENMVHNFGVGVEFAGLDIDEIEKEKYCRGLEADDIGLGNCSLG